MNIEKGLYRQVNGGMMMSCIKVGLVGAGNIANVHLSAYQKLSNVELTAICDINETVLHATADRFGIVHRYTDIDDMLKAHPELDAVDVCVWNNHHASCTVKALDAGKHVLCEKPMAYNAAQARQMIDAAKRSGKLLMIGFSMRFSDMGKIAKDFVDQGYIGDIYYSKALYVRRHGAPGGWFTDIEKSGGGPVIDLGVHVIDLTRYLMGNPKPVSVYAATFSHLGKRDNVKLTAGYQSVGAKKDEPYTVEDSAIALIRYENGAVTQLETAYHIHAESVTTRQIYGTKGGMIMENDTVKLYTDYNNYLANIDLTTNAPGSSHEVEIAHFVDCVANGTECLAKAEDGLVIMQILDAIYESAKTGHEVILSE